MTVKPFRSKAPGTEVYHNNNQCAEGSSIESSNREDGIGGLRLCSSCKDLNAQK